MEKMTIEQKAREYALEALKDQLAKVEQAYIDGYTAGRDENKLRTELADEYVFADMGLSSGTFWSILWGNRHLGADYRKLTYSEAAQLDIPTKEEFEELKRHVDSSCFFSGPGFRYYMWISETGKEIPIFANRFWVKDDSEDETMACTVGGDFDYKPTFKGESHAVILVKRPKK